MAAAPAGGGRKLELERLTGADVTGFLARECPRRSVLGARNLVAGLRPLLRYLHVAGLIESPLVWAVPGVADLPDRSLPRGLEPAVVADLLASCDRRRTVGRRLKLGHTGIRHGAWVHPPFLEPSYFAALARASGLWGWGDRTETTAPSCGAGTGGPARPWPRGRRCGQAMWISPRPHSGSTLTLQAAWLASRPAQLAASPA